MWQDKMMYFGDKSSFLNENWRNLFNYLNVDILQQLYLLWTMEDSLVYTKKLIKTKFKKIPLICTVLFVN